MKNFFKKTLLLSSLIFISGCGNQQEIRSNLDKYHAQDQNKITKKVKKENKSPVNEKKDSEVLFEDECPNFKDGNPTKVSIIDANNSCHSNAIIYHPEYNKTKGEFKPSFSYGLNIDKTKYILDFKSNKLKNAIHILGYDAKVLPKNEDEYQGIYKWDEYQNYQNKFDISWDAKFKDDVIFYVVVGFDNNNTHIQKDLIYTTLKHDVDDVDLTRFMKIDINETYKDGKWHHFQRNILDDIHKFYPTATMNYDLNSSQNINGFAIRGSTSITNLNFRE